MPDQLNAAIPAEKESVVNRALETAFGATGIEDLSVPTGGLSSALIFRISVRGKPYLLRVIMSDDVTRHLTRWFGPMQAAAGAGIAPAIRYASLEEGVLITDFVQPQPYPPDMALRLAPVLRTLQSLPGFPAMSATGSYMDFITQSVQRVRSADLLPESRVGDLFTRYEQIIHAYPFGEPDLVASHNDLKPQNILFDGERVWLVDWEAAFLNHRFSDLSIVANFFVGEAVSEDAYLAAYFGAPPTDLQRARFFLMRQAMHMSYLTFMLLMAARSGAPIDLDGPAPDFHEFHRRLLANEVDVMLPGPEVEYARVHLEALQHNLHAPRFADSLALVGGPQPGA